MSSESELTLMKQSLTKSTEIVTDIEKHALLLINAYDGPKNVPLLHGMKNANWHQNIKRTRKTSIGTIFFFQNYPNAIRPFSSAMLLFPFSVFLSCCSTILLNTKTHYKRRCALGACNYALSINSRRNRAL